MTLPREELRAKLDEKRRSLDRARGVLESGDYPAENRHSVHYSVGVRYHGVGAFHIALGELDPAREAFADAARHYLSAAVESRPYRREPPTDKWRNEPIRLVRGLYCAVVAGTDDTLSECAREMLSLDDDYLERYPAQLFYRAKALAAVVLDDDRQREFVEAFEAAVDPHFVPDDEAIARVCRGLLDAEESAVVGGVEDLLEHHRDRIDGEPDSKSEVLSLPATALLVLARDRGLDAWVDSEFVPDVLVER